MAEASSGEEAVRRLRTDPAYDSVVMDIMMPGMDGVEACRSIRSFSTAPSCSLTAKTQLGGQGLRLCKRRRRLPAKALSQSELLMKVDSLLRRYRVYKGKREEVLDASLHLDEDRRCAVKMAAWWSSPARNTTFSILFPAPGKVLDVRSVYEGAWGRKHMPTSTNTVMVHILNLRKKAGGGPYQSQADPDHLGKGVSIWLKVSPTAG